MVCRTRPCTSFPSHFEERSIVHIRMSNGVSCRVYVDAHSIASHRKGRICHVSCKCMSQLGGAAHREGSFCAVDVGGAECTGSNTCHAQVRRVGPEASRESGTRRNSRRQPNARMATARSPDTICGRLQGGGVTWAHARDASRAVLLGAPMCGRAADGAAPHDELSRVARPSIRGEQ